MTRIRRDDDVGQMTSARFVVVECVLVYVVYQMSSYRSLQVHLCALISTPSAQYDDRVLRIYGVQAQSMTFQSSRYNVVGTRSAKAAVVSLSHL